MSEILFISHKYPPSTGGMEKFSYELIQQFEQNEIHIHKLVFDNSESKIKWFLLLKRRIRKILYNNPNIKIIHLNDGLMAAYCLWIKREFDIHVVATIHGLDIVFPLSYFQHKIVPQFNHYDQLICVSHATKKECIKRGIAENKITVILNGVDHKINVAETSESNFQLLKRYHIREGKKLLVGLGRPVKRKGYSWFVNHVLSQLPEDIVFILMGPKGSYNDRLWNKIIPKSILYNVELMFGLGSDEMNLREAEAKYPHKFIRTGYLTSNEMNSLFKLSGIFIMPNIKVENDMEGFGLVALEASLNNCIVIASDTEGITDAIKDNQNGYMIPLMDVEKWITKINEISNDKNISELKLAFTDYTRKHYSWIKMGDEYLQLFQNLLKK